MRKLFLAAALAGMLAVPSSRPAQAAEPVVRAPAPSFNAELANEPGSATVILSGGCFWGVQVVFQHVKGVREAISGYTGGSAATAHYADVSTGTTGHAESVKIIFDPSVVSYGTLLRVYFSVATNPTELNYQGPDQGSQYRGEIWVENATQRRIAEAYIRQLTADRTYAAPIVTRVQKAMPFYPAEPFHQNFATRHPGNLYIVINDAPKVRSLARLFPRLYATHPVLVRTASIK
ncbi:MAG: peptide-methionine (S)-S-oxide reductase MsrA [Acetobacteraceae bacterium]